MAELAFAIVGVTANGASLVKCVTDIASSVKGAEEDAEAIRTQLDIHQDVLHQILNLYKTNPEIFSQDVISRIRRLTVASDRVYVKVRHVLAPLARNSFGKDSGPSLKARMKWHFQKDDVRILLAQLEATKSSLQMVLSILILGRGIERDRQQPEHTDRITLKLERELLSARDVHAHHQKCIEVLQHLEEMYSTSVSPSTKTLSQDPGFATEIESALSLKEIDTENMSEEKSQATSSAALSEKQKSIIGERSEEIAILVERWTTVSEASPSHLGETRDLYSEGQSEESESDPHSEIPSEDNHGINVLEQTPATPLGLHVQKTAKSGRSVGKAASSRDITEINSTPVEHHTTDGDEHHNVNRDNGHAESSNIAPSLEIRSPDCTILTEVEAPAEMPHEADAPGNKSDNSVRISSQMNEVRLPSVTYTQAWINQLDEVKIEDIMAACGGYRGPFSDVTILDHGFSRAPSVVTDFSSIHGDDDPRRAEKLYRMAENLFKEKLYNGALEVFQKVYLLRDSLPPDKVYHLTFRIGLCLAEMRNLALAEKVFKYAVQLQLPPNVSADHQSELHHFLARTLARQDKWPQARLIYTDLWSGRAEVLQQTTAKASAIDRAIRTGQEYSKVLVELGEGGKALEVLEIIKSRAIEMRGINDKVVFNTLLDLGRAHCQIGQIQQAELILNDLLLKVKSSPVHAEMVGACWHGLAVAAYRSQRYDESQRMATMAVESRKKNGRPTILSITSSRYVALAEVKLGGLVNAKSSFQKLRKQALSVAGSGHIILTQLDIDLAHTYLHQHQYRDAEMMLSIAAESLMPQLEKISSKTAASTHPVSRQLLEQLAPLMVRNAWSLDVTKKHEKFNEAIAMYKALYILHGHVHGQESTIYLQTGHDYGSLCLRLNQLKSAGDVLEQVWEARSKTLGADDPATMGTALQLGQTRFARNSKAEGLSILNSVFELSKQSASPSNLQTIQSAEILGHYYMFKGLPKELARDPFVYIKAAFDARQAAYGPTQQTCKTALEVAFFSLKRRDLNLTQELLNYVFEQGYDTLTPVQTQNHMRSMIVISGLASSILMFASNRKKGNRKMSDIIVRTSAMFGSTALITDQMRTLYAIVLVAQNKLSGSIDILRTVYHRRLDLSGMSKVATKSLGMILGGVLALRALARGDSLPIELDAIDSSMEPCCLSLTRMQLVAAVLAFSAAEFMWTEVSRPLLKWIYRRQKRTYGRFSRETLTVLAIIHAWRSYRLVSRVRRKGNENEPVKPEVQLGELMDRIWPTCTRGLNAGLELIATQKSMKVERFFRLMSTQIAKEKLWKQFTTQLEGDTSASEMSESFFDEFDTGALPDCWEPPQVPIVDSDDDAISQVWTINSEEEEQIEADKPIDLVDILGLQRAGSTSSFVGSLLDLTSSSQAEVERAESCIDQIGSRLVNEAINGTDMEKVKNERVQLEIEAGVWDDEDEMDAVSGDEN